MFRTVPLSIIRSFSLYTQQWYTSYSTIRTQPSWFCSQAVSKPVWHTPLQCVHCKTPDDGQRNCPKHVEFYSKNKFGKLVHLVGFIIRICHDARSPERQIRGLATYGVTATASYTYVHPCNLVSLFPAYSKFLHSVFCCGKLWEWTEMTRWMKQTMTNEIRKKKEKKEWTCQCLLRRGANKKCLLRLLRCAR